jgi:hypothetical protein
MIRNKINRALSKYRKDGIVSLSKSIYMFSSHTVTASLREITPVKRNAIWNGVKMSSDIAPKHRWIDDFIQIIQTDYEESEGGEVEFHKEFTQQGDTVVIIGGGRGVTTVRSAQESGPDGHVSVFEASEEYSSIIREVIELNSVESRCEIQTAIIGPLIDAEGGSHDKTKRVPPKDLPSCDVLEMDCEGSETEIISNMEIRPRIVIIEVHPQKYEFATEAIDRIREIGYDIAGYRTNRVKTLTKNQFEDVLERCSRGQTGAPVIAAVSSSESSM